MKECLNPDKHLGMRHYGLAVCEHCHAELEEENQRLTKAIDKLIEEYNHETFSIKDLLKLKKH